MRPQHSDSFIHSLKSGAAGSTFRRSHTPSGFSRYYISDIVREAVIDKHWHWQHCYFNNYIDICNCFHCLRCKIPIHRSRQVLDFILSRGISVQKAFLAIPMAKRRVYFNGGLICRPRARQLPSTLRNFWYTTQNKRIAEAHQRCGDRFQVRGKQGSRSYFRWYLVAHQSWEKQRDKAPIN